MPENAKPDLPAKPLGRKAYGSTPHLPGSRVGPGDWFMEPAQARLLIERCRWDSNHRDRVIVSEKLDGSCVAVARVADQIYALNRAGYDCRTSPYEVHRGFSRWVEANAKLFLDHLGNGERTVGEWMQIAHGTIYDIRDDMELFVPFDIFTVGKDRGNPERRVGHDELHERAARMGLRPAHVLSDGPAIPIDEAVRLLGPRGFHGATEDVEGVVYRLETNGKFNFLAKFVRDGKIDGKYLSGLHSNAVTEDVYNGEAALRWAA